VGVWGIYDQSFIGVFGSSGNVVSPSVMWNSGQIFEATFSSGHVGFLEGRFYNTEDGGLTAVDLPWLRPDGTSCSTTNTSFYAAVICPLGFASSSSSEPSSSSSELSSSSSAGDGSSSSSNGLGQSSGSDNGLDLCDEFPDLPRCGCLKNPNLPQCHGAGNCVDLANCDWAKLDVQLQQLSVETQIRNKIREMAELAEKGYNLSVEQKALLDSVVGKLSGINKGLDSLRSGLGDAIAEGLGKFAGDTAGTGAFNNSLSEYGNGSGSAMGDSLGNGAGAKDKIKKSIKIDSASFAFLGNSSNCPVWDFTFATEYVSCTKNCKIKLCDVYGFNAGQYMRAIIWLFALAGVLFMNLRVLQTGGR